MGVILKHIIRSIWEKKLRTFLIIFSIVISSSMFFASTTISNTLVKMQMDQWRNNYGYSDIIITADRNSSTQFFYINRAEKYAKNMEYIIGSVSGYALYDSPEKDRVGINLKGFDLDELQTLTPLRYTKDSRLAAFKGMKIIISQKTSEKYSLDVGGVMTVDVNGSKHKYTICGIAYQAGPFANETEVINAIVPKEQLCSLYDARGKVDTVYIKLKNQLAGPMIRYKLSQEYKRFAVKEPFNEKEVKRKSDSIATPILIVTVLLSFMTVYIIYSTFKIIVMERLPAIGTFRSIGARKVTTDLILLSESICYGIIGGGLGCLAGIGLLKAMSFFLMPEGAGSSSSIEFSYAYLLSTFLMANVLCFVSSIIPIFRVSAMPIKEIVLNLMQSRHTGRGWTFMAGLCLLAISLSAPNLLPGGINLWADIVCIILAFLAVILLIPFVTKGLTKILVRLYPYIFGNEGVLAAKNVGENKNILNNISLLVIGISFFFIIITANYGEINQISDYFNRNIYDISMNINYANKNMLNVIASTGGVEDVCGNYSHNGTDIVGRDSNIWLVQGIDTGKFLEYYDIDMQGDKKSIIQELDKGRNILLTNALKNKIDVITGDIITLRFYLDNGSYTERNYKITGFFEDIIQGGGSYALISQGNYRQDIGGSYYNPIYIKTSESTGNEINVLNNLFARQKPVITSVDEKKKEILTNYRQTFAILTAFSSISILVGAFGVLNNLIISFIQRKRSLAIFRSIGMSKAQIIKMIFVEAFTGGLIGGVTGVILGALNLSLIMSNIMESLNIFSRIYYSWTILIFCMLSGIVITFITSVVPAVSLAKLNIIEAIKYE